MSARAITILVAGLFGLAATALGADAPKQGWSFGKDQYNARCAPCHGVSGKGDGPAAKQLGAPLPDLTTYAKRNGGKFPTDLAWQKIDGRPTTFNDELMMPVWGRVFRHEAMAGVTPTTKPETYVAAEIYAVVEHVKGMQVK